MYICCPWWADESEADAGGLGDELSVQPAPPSAGDGGSLADVRLESGETLSARAFILGCGPWFLKVLPDLTLPAFARFHRAEGCRRGARVVSRRPGAHLHDQSRRDRLDSARRSGARRTGLAHGTGCRREARAL